MANGHGGRRAGSGRRPGMTKTNGEMVLGRFRRATAAEILAGANEVKLWRDLLQNKDKWLVLSAMRYLTDRRDGKPYQGVHPLQAGRLVAGEDPKLTEVLRNLLPPAAEITVTEKSVRIQALEKKGSKARAKLGLAPSTVETGSAVTLDASALSQDDPSTRETGGEHSGGESHTERNQDSKLAHGTEKVGLSGQ